MYLGRYCRLEITADDAPGVRFQNRFYISRRQQARAGQLLREWHVKRAREKLTPKAHYFAESLGVTPNQILISDMKYRWASCTPKNNLNFSWRIMKAPPFVIDYLIVHELAHLLEPNHTPQFWNIIAVQVPRYEEAKDWLRDHGNVLEEDFWCLLSHPTRRDEGLAHKGFLIEWPCCLLSLHWKSYGTGIFSLVKSPNLIRLRYRRGSRSFFDRIAGQPPASSEYPLPYLAPKWNAPDEKCIQW